jgi:hypothetical protein
MRSVIKRDWRKRATSPRLGQNTSNAAAVTRLKIPRATRGSGMFQLSVLDDFRPNSTGLAGNSWFLWYDKQQLSQVMRQDLALAVDLQRQGAVERGTRHHDHTSARVEVKTTQVAQPLAVLRVNPLKLDHRARR